MLVVLIIVTMYLKRELLGTFVSFSKCTVMVLIDQMLISRTVSRTRRYVCRLPFLTYATLNTPIL